MNRQECHHRVAAVLMTAIGLLAAGCGPDAPAVFDKAAIGQMNKVVVLPLQSPQDPAAGAVRAGMMTAQLQASKLPKMTVVEPPALWRLDPPEPTSGTTDVAALRIARLMGADGVLTGTATYTVELSTSEAMPEHLQKNMQAVEFQRSFAERMGAASVTVRVLSVRHNRPVYTHTVTGQGTEHAEVLRQVGEDVLKPFVDFVKSR